MIKSGHLSFYISENKGIDKHMIAKGIGKCQSQKSGVVIPDIMMITFSL